VVCVTNSFKEKVKGRKRKTVAVHYEGSLENGKVFDSSYPRKKTEFRLGQGRY
jgi:peptidyl-prolyl cis-trans isomerase A (cyclophilin A)